MITVFPRANDAWVLVEAERDLGLEGEARSFKDNLWAELVSHNPGV
ncbi:MAG TPA: hypothetical protein VF784_11055 [Anaerolineales bacterium]